MVSLSFFLPDSGSEQGGAVSAGLVEFAQRRAGGHGELPQGPQHHLPAGTLAPDQPTDGQDWLQLPGRQTGSEYELLTSLGFCGPGLVTDRNSTHQVSAVSEAFPTSV